MDELEAIQLVAFSLVAKTRRNESSGDPAYIFRQIHRWYSKTFSTELHKVYELPTFDVLQAFYEERYESMEDQDLEQERLELIKTDKQRELEAIERAKDDVEGFQMAEEIEKENGFIDPIDGLAREAEKFKGALTRFKDKPPSLGRENTIEVGGIKTNIQPNIKMTFVDELDDLDSDSIGMLESPKV